MILGIDTSLGTTVAVVEADGVILAQVDSAEPLAHAEVIGTLLERALAEAQAVGGRAGRGEGVGVCVGGCRAASHLLCDCT
ncbi:hypothetical protein [Microbacterium elymi]|uniref:tRNA (Adenosine(37)-N6)-threonylcarbamoyltransferase complex dimerization subunit type 1 TsaB n=1 Tax=Microbacterium elymi TaxID=2909587 RepID=A0ABY5NL43_9MICO|nr:hypothetical protein [Microbacterium elymi]UUT35892.1 hypothetical protein L2X98_22310 [Microbacterium elymi]